MSDSENVVETIAKGGVVPVVRLSDLSQAIDLTAALLDGGVTAIELTMTSPGALKAISRLHDAFPAFGRKDVVLGMGSVVGKEAAERAIEAGASFIVSPILDRSVIEVCHKQHVPIMPAGLTPTEIQQAWELGAALVKVFPANRFGPGYFKDLLAPLPHLRLMPTGGVSLENVADYVGNGAVAVGVGSSLVDPGRIKAGDWDGLKKEAARYITRVREAREDR